MPEENRPEGAGVPVPPEQPNSYPQQAPGQYPLAQQSSEPEKRHVHHSYIWLGSLQVAFSLFVAFFIMIFVAILKDKPLFIGGQAIGSTALIAIGVIVVFLVILAISVVIHVLSYRHLYYELGPDEFNFYSGIFNKKRAHVPYQRIQSVNQKATLIQRIAGVCFVHIDTAGGSANKAVTIPYLQNTEAESLRAELFARKQAMIAGQAAQKAVQAGVSQGSVAQVGYPGASNVLDAPAEILTDVRGVFGGTAVDTGVVTYEYGMSNKELILTGLSNNTGLVLVMLAVIGGLGGLAEQILSTAIGRMVIDGGVNIVMSSFAGNAVWAVTGVCLLVFFVIWVLSVIGVCLSYGGFKARRRDSRIEVEHGLLQHQFHGVDVDRIQSVTIKQGFVRRLFGYCEISLGKIDAVTENAEEQQQGITPRGLIVHPFVKTKRVPEILAGLIPEFADVPTESKPVAQVALRRAIIRRGILLGNGFWLAILVAIAQILSNVFAGSIEAEFSNAMSYINTGATILYVICALILVLDVIGAVMWFRGSGFAFNRRFMQITNGGFSRETVSFPRKKIQYGFVKTNPFQRNARVATIKARTAAGVGGTTLKLVDVREEDANTWLEWVKPGGSMVQ